MTNLIAALRDCRDALRYSDGVGYEQHAVAHEDHASLATEHDELGYPTRRGLEDAERFIARAKHWTPLAWKMYDAWSRLKICVDILSCAFGGHDLVDNSYGGPDSGCVAMSCRRCGWSFHHTLY